MRREMRGKVRKIEEMRGNFKCQSLIYQSWDKITDGVQLHIQYSAFSKKKIKKKLKGHSKSLQGGGNINGRILTRILKSMKSTNYHSDAEVHVSGVLEYSTEPF